jgi:hypothetical protein
MLPRMRLMFASLLLLVPACGGGDDAGGPDAGDAPSACTGCAAGQGCLTITVTRTADVSAQPWTVWPAEADGKGALIVSAREGATVHARVTLANADMVPAAASYRLDLGCVPATALTLGAFLDDNLTAASTDTSSSDYRDSCMLDRQPIQTIQAGVANDVALALNNSCD